MSLKKWHDLEVG